MHPVLEHILERKDKSVPIDDGRRIALVLHSGAMRGVRSGGAMIALQDLGLSNTFDYIFTNSAGFPNACYLLSDQTRLGTSIYYEDLSGRNFIDFRNILMPWKVADINHLVETMKTRKKLEVQKVLKAKTKLFLRLFNQDEKRPEYFKVNDFQEEEFFKLMAAATSMKCISQPVQIKGSNYRDGINNSDSHYSHTQQALSSDATDVLIIYNHPKNRTPLMQSERYFEICPNPNWQLKRFETRSPLLRRAARQMGNLVFETFGYNRRLKL